MRPCSFSLPRPTFKAEGVGAVFARIWPDVSPSLGSLLILCRLLRPPARSLEKRKSAAERKTTTVRCIGKEKKKAIWKVCNPFHSKFPSRLFCNGIVPYKKEIYSLCAPQKNFFPRRRRRRVNPARARARSVGRIFPGKLGY